MMLIVLLYLR